MGIDELPRDGQQVIQGQQQGIVATNINVQRDSMIIEEFFKAKKIPSSKRVQLLDRILDSTLQGASKGYKINLDKRKIVCIIDNTVFGSGADGCVIFFNGIGLREAFQPPKFIKFDDISEMNLEGKNLTIKAGSYYKYQFHMPEAHELAPVFDALVEWLSNRATTAPISDKELIEARKKLSASEEAFRLLVRLSMRYIEQEHESLMLEGISSCVDEIQSLRDRIDNQSITKDELTSIKRISAILEAGSAVFDDPLNKKFDRSLLVKTRVDGPLFEYLAGFMPPVMQAIEVAVASELARAKIGSFLDGDSEVDASPRSRSTAVQRMEPTELLDDAPTPFGKVFVQRPGLGVASYHFESEGNCYLDYSNAPQSWTLDDGKPLPLQKEFEGVFYDKQKRIFAAWVIWSDPEESTFTGEERWLYQIHFNEDCTEIVAGTVLTFNENAHIARVHRFGSELKYKLLTEEPA